MVDDPLFDGPDADLDGQAPAPATVRRSARSIDDADAIELQDEGAAPQASRLMRVLDDPETLSAEDEEPTAKDAVPADEVAQAEKLDLASMGRGKRNAIEEDAFEDFLKLSRKYPPLSAADTEKYLAMRHSADPELQDLAKDKLIRHNIRFIVQVLKQKAGPLVMDRPSEMRNDLLSIGRMGFLEGIERYDDQKAMSPEGRKAGLLTYGKYWIIKFANEYLGIERFGLKEDAAADRAKITYGRKALVEATGKEPTIPELEQYLLEQAHRKLAQKGVGSPTTYQLRRAGALTADRIKDILRHQTTKASLDASATEDADGPSYGETIAEDKAGAADELETRERRRGVDARLALVPGRLNRVLFRAQHGFAAEFGGGTYVELNGEELARLSGVATRDSVLAWKTRTQETLAAERAVEAPADLGALPAELARDAAIVAHTAPFRALAKEGIALPIQRTYAVEGRIRAALSLPAVVRAQGVAIDPTDATKAVPCPFEGQNARAKTFTVSEDGYCCSNCGRAGDVFRWLEETKGLTRLEAVVEATRLLTVLPARSRRPDGTVVLVDVAAKHRRLRNLMS